MLPCSSYPPIFSIERVNLQYSAPSTFSAAQVSNNIITIGLKSGRILRIDLDCPEKIDEIELPKRVQDAGIIDKLFLDPTGCHLLIGTTLNDYFYLHKQSSQAKSLSKLKGIPITCVSWNPDLPTVNTREILLGCDDGCIYELCVQPTTEFYRREERIFKRVYQFHHEKISGIWTSIVDKRFDTRQVIVSTQNRVLKFRELSNTTERRLRNVYSGEKDSNVNNTSYFSRFFNTSVVPIIEDFPTAEFSYRPSLSVYSDELSLAYKKQRNDTHNSRVKGGNTCHDTIFAWLLSSGIYHGYVDQDEYTCNEDDRIMKEAKFLPRSVILGLLSNGQNESFKGSGSFQSMVISQWHILLMINNRVVIVNRLDYSVVLNQVVMDRDTQGTDWKSLGIGLKSDLFRKTYWLFTPGEIFEIVTNDESRDVWKIFFRFKQYETALEYAESRDDKDTVTIALGDSLIENGSYMKAVQVYSKSNKPMEKVALLLMEAGQREALQEYLLLKLGKMKKHGNGVPRMVLSTWIMELFMTKLNQLDATEYDESNGEELANEEKKLVRLAYEGFIDKFKDDIDSETAYEIMNNYGREDELIYFALAIEDFYYVIDYLIQRERWNQAANVLQRQTDAEVFYKYHSILMMNIPREIVDILMRQRNLDVKRLIPGFLAYNKRVKHVDLSQNQAIRYLLYEISFNQSTDPAVHNTLISLYASHDGRDESALLSYMEEQGYLSRRRSLLDDKSSSGPLRQKFEMGKEIKWNYDPDLALRLCLQNKRLQCCVLILTSMEKFVEAMSLALQFGEMSLAEKVAESPGIRDNLRKKLWLMIAQKLLNNISQTESSQGSIKSLGVPHVGQVLNLMKRSMNLLKIEDLIPLFPDFVVMEDFRDEIFTALEGYSRQLDKLNHNMVQTQKISKNLIEQHSQLIPRRYSIIQPEDSCYICKLPLLIQTFCVFPCNHAFHDSCLSTWLTLRLSPAKTSRMRHLNKEIQSTVKDSQERKDIQKDLDDIILESCILCDDLAIKLIDKPFVSAPSKAGLLPVPSPI